MNVRNEVERLMIENPATRENDNLLIAYFMKDNFKMQNTFDIALQFKSNVYETISRARRKIQETNPNLRPPEEVYKARLKKEQEVRDEMRGV